MQLPNLVTSTIRQYTRFVKIILFYSQPPILRPVTSHLTAVKHETLLHAVKHHTLLRGYRTTIQLLAYLCVLLLTSH